MLAHNGVTERHVNQLRQYVRDLAEIARCGELEVLLQSAWSVNQVLTNPVTATADTSPWVELSSLVDLEIERHLLEHDGCESAIMLSLVNDGRATKRVERKRTRDIGWSGRGSVR